MTDNPKKEDDKPAKPDRPAETAGGGTAGEPAKPAEQAKEGAAPRAAAEPAAKEPARAASEPGQPWAAKKPETTAKEAAKSGVAAAAEPPKAKGPPAKARKRRGCLASVLWLAAIVVVIGVVGYLTWPQWSPAVAPYLQATLPPTERNEQIAALEGRLGELEQAVKQRESIDTEARARENEALATLESQASSLNAQVNEMLARMAAVERQITDLREAPVSPTVPGTAVPNAVLQRLSRLEAELHRFDGLDRQLQDTAEIGRRLTELEAFTKGTREAAAGASAMALALDRLAQALHRSEPFTAEIDAVRAAAGTDPVVLDAVSALEPNAASGVPTVAELYRRFGEVAAGVVRADAELEGEGWIQRTANRLSSLVAVRRTGEAAVAAGGTDATIALAEQRLAAGDLKGAVDALDTLQGAPREAAAAWIDGARARLTVEKVLARLQLRAITLLSAKGD